MRGRVARVAVVLVVVLVVAGRTGTATNWCYDEEWCRALDHSVPVTERSDTWPPSANLVAVRLNMTDPGIDALRRSYLTGNRTIDAGLELTLRDVLDELLPYPVSTRERAKSQFHEGHDKTLMISGEPQAGPKPAFTQPSHDVDVLKGEKFGLECRVKNSDGHSIEWFNGTQRRTSGRATVSPLPRISVDENYTLWVRDASRYDSGTWRCQVGALENFNQNSTVSVMGPAVPVPLQAGETDQEAAWNSTVVMRCPATGRPQPRVIWLKQGVRHRLAATGQSHIIHAARRHHAGTYLCVLSNGIGPRIVRTFRIRVQHPPVIRECSDERTDGTAGAVQVTIKCKVDALPVAQRVSWAVPRSSEGQIELQQRNRTTKGRYHGRAGKNFNTVELAIDGFTHHDLGVYTIRASNGVGSTTLHMHNVTSKAHPVVFTHPQQSPSETAFNISFRYESYLAPARIRVLYRNFHSDGALDIRYDSQGLLMRPDFGENSIDAVADRKKGLGPDEELYGWKEKYENAGGLQHEYTVALRELEPGSEYEVFVQVNNMEGWSTVAKKPFQFATQPQYQQQQESVGAVTSSSSRTGASLAQLALGFLLMAL